MTASVQFVLRLELKFLSTEFFQINGFDHNSEIASTPLTDGADTYYREGRFLGIFYFWSPSAMTSHLACTPISRHL